MRGQVHAPAAVPLEKLWRVDGIQTLSGGSGEEKLYCPCQEPASP